MGYGNIIRVTTLPNIMKQRRQLNFLGIYFSVGFQGRRTKKLIPLARKRMRNIVDSENAN
jgi:hypothetical protein